MATRIAIYGGTNLTPSHERFVRVLTRRLLKDSNVIILSGGFRRYKRHRHHLSVDAVVADEAEKCVPPEEFYRRFETWRARVDLDRKSVDRFAKGTVRWLTGSDQERRFKMVKAVDAVVTIGGEGHTRTVLELALALATPALPIAFTGGDSELLWQRHAKDLVSNLRLPKAVVARFAKRPPAHQLARVATRAAKRVLEAAQRRCLVLMPFGRVHNKFYKRILKPAIAAAGYLPYRLDYNEQSGHIVSLFVASFERARAVVLDVTGSNPNVMYELGQVHARGIDPFVLVRTTRAGERLPLLPFYLQQEKLSIVRRRKTAGLERDLARYLARLHKSPEAGHRRDRGISAL